MILYKKKIRYNTIGRIGNNLWCYKKLNDNDDNNDYLQKSNNNDDND